MLVKFALMQMRLVQDARTPEAARKTAQRTQFTYDPLPGHIYFRSRAISSRVNENYDGFRPEEIKAAWRTFIGKPVFVNHHNEDITRARGVIVDAALHEDTNPNNSPDTWVELLMAIDAVKFPKLAEAIVTGDVDRTSMGTAVAYTLCSVCGNKAETPAQYCNHIARMKGQRVLKTVNGKKQAVLVYEDCHGLHFFENSVLVEDPADPTAHVFDVDTRGTPDLVRSASAVRLAFVFRPMCVEPDVVEDLHTAAAGPKWAPDQHPWFQTHPVSSQNIMDHWNRATPEDIEQGSRWYPDAQIVAKALGNGNTHKGAGVLAAYSPQTLWPVNMLNAAHALSSGKAIGGKGSGVFATASMANQAQRIIDGERHENVLKSPKISDFAHLIEHGGDADPTQPHVVVDRHAMSVAAGRRLTDDDLEGAPVSNRHYYGHFVKQYKDAADQLTQKLGHPVYPHQVQATTWLVRQRENAEADHAAGKPLGLGRERSRVRAGEDWNSYAGEHYPDLVGPGYHAASRKVASMRKTADLVAQPSMFEPSMMVLHDPQIGKPVGRVHQYFTKDDAGQRSHGYRYQIYNNDEPGESAGSYTSEQMHPDLDSAVAAANQHYQQFGRGEDAPENRIAVQQGALPAPSATLAAQTAPPSVNTLLPEACPICGDVDSWNNNQCTNCGWEGPPEPFGTPDTSKAQEADRNDGEPLNDEQPQPPLYLGSGHPRTTVSREEVGMTNNTAARAQNAHKRIDALGERIDEIVSGQNQLLAYLKSAGEMPPQFKKKDDDSSDAKSDESGKKDDDSDDSDSDDDSDSSDSDDHDDDDSDDDSDSGSDSDSSKSSSLRDRRRQAYLALKKTSEDNASERAPAAKDDPSNIGSVPSSANTNVTPDATTSVDSAPTSTNLTEDNAEKENVQAAEPGVDDVPSPDAAKAPIDVVVGVPADNSSSFNTGGPDNISWASKGEPQTRLFAAMHLAKLRATAGISAEDELVAAQKIADSDSPLPVIQAISQELQTVIAAAQARQTQRTASANLVPQAQNRPEGQRSRPSLAGGIRTQASTGAVSSEEFGDLI